MGGFNADARDRELAFTGKDEPATFPRVSQLYILTRHSPWVTEVKNERGVTSSDILTTLWKEYASPHLSPFQTAMLMRKNYLSSLATEKTQSRTRSSRHLAREYKNTYGG
jgi:hypothetical protein